MHVDIAPYPNFAPALFVTSFPEPLASFPSPAWLTDLLSLDAAVPVSRSEERRKGVRDLLRHEGYKPTGRGKPASEYLVKAAEAGRLGSINAPVDACNVVSLHSGLPISVVDLAHTSGALQIKPGDAAASYVFNASGQEISVAGLLCLHDAAGPCANPVKDAQRTKTSDTTTRTLSIIWGPEVYSAHVQSTLSWYLDLLQQMGCDTRIV